ncbi:MAG: DUF1127 domain-containing protein [Sneathiella sp.]
MTTAPSHKQSASCHRSRALFNIVDGLWRGLGNALQRMSQNRINHRTYSLLLQNDDYLLRDIGVNRDDIRRRSNRNEEIDAGRELEKLRATNGRLLVRR